jgi:hypothetical protein
LPWISRCADGRRLFFAVPARVALEDVLSDRTCLPTAPFARQPGNALGHIEAADAAGRTLRDEPARQIARGAFDGHHPGWIAMRAHVGFDEGRAADGQRLPDSSL